MVIKDFLKQQYIQKLNLVRYEYAFVSKNDVRSSILQVDELEKAGNWSADLEAVHEGPTKLGWIEVYERSRVLEAFGKLVGNDDKLILEFGASSGYMIEEFSKMYPENKYIATDLYIEGLQKSYNRNPQIMHIQCDITNAPFCNECMDFIYGLNVLEHIEDDVKTIKECYRMLKPGGYCLYVVPRGPHLYDYYDEMLYHKRRYAKNELREKCNDVGFEVIQNFHFAWVCYPAFWLKKRLNQFVGTRLTQKEKLQRVECDINNAMYSSLGDFAMTLEHMLSKHINPSFGIRELIVLKK